MQTNKKRANKKNKKKPVDNGKSMFSCCNTIKPDDAFYVDENNALQQPQPPQKTIFNFLREINVESESKSVMYQLESMQIADNDETKKEQPQKQPTVKRIRILARPKIEFKYGLNILHTHYGQFVMPKKTDIVDVVAIETENEQQSNRRILDIMLKNNGHCYVTVHIFERNTVIDYIKAWYLPFIVKL